MKLGASFSAVVIGATLLFSSNSGSLAQPSKQPIPESLRGIRATTSSAVILMPVVDKSGQGSALSEFATEVVNQAVRNGGIKTLAWFKVEKQLRKEIMGTTSSNPFAYSGSGGGAALTSDSNMNEIIQTGKKLGARYILRPVILKQSDNSTSELKVRPTVGMFFGFGGPSVKTETTQDAEVDVKVDIISVKEEDIIASKTFSGRSREVNKDRANRLDGITGMQIFSGGSTMDGTKIAFYDTIDKIVDFMQSKTQ